MIRILITEGVVLQPGIVQNSFSDRACDETNEVVRIAYTAP